MSKAKRPTIGAVARESRQIVEGFAQKNPHIGDIQDLECYCAIGAYIVTESLRGFGYRAHLRVGYYNDWTGWADDNGMCHAWSECESKSVDITATQFRGIKTPVLIYRVGSRIYRRRYWARMDPPQLMLQAWGNQNPWRHKADLDLCVQEVIDNLS